MAPLGYDLHSADSGHSANARPGPARYGKVIREAGIKPD
jgi:hypothetical protein